MRGSRKQGYRERRALAEDALRIDRSRMQPDELLHEREPDASAFVRSRAGAADAMKPLENMRQLCSGDSGAGVRDRQRHPLAVAAQPHGNLPFEREFQRVRQQVQHDLLPHLAVDVDIAGQRVTVDDEA